MLHLLAFLTATFVIFTGVYVLAKGDWRKFGLKFAAVSLSTTAAGWLLGAEILFGGSVISCPLDMPATTCLTFEAYHVVRNIAFIIFHIATGRDAISYKHKDRRGAAWPTNTLKQSSRL